VGLTVALAAVALGGAGCQSVAKSGTDMMRAVGLNKPAPPNQFICIVEPNILYQPDTTKNGQPAALMLGKVYLFGADQKPVEADGQLTVVLNDTTVRPPGAAQRDRSIVHIDAATFKKLGANDERFGRHFVVPLPWPDGWGDVTHVTVQARYSPSKATGVPDLFNPESRFAVNPGTPTIFDQKTGLPTNGPNPNIPTAMGVPDPDQLLKQFAAGGGWPVAVPTAGGMTTPPIQQAGSFMPTTTTVGPNGSKVTSGAWALPAPGQPIQPGMPTIQPPAAFGPQPGLPPTPGNLPPTRPGPPGSGSQPFVWPPPGGVTLPPVGPVGELRPDGVLQPVVIPRQ